VALISSVSGGSLGSMIYAASFAEKIGPGDVAGNARKSAIDEVSVGIDGARPVARKAALVPNESRHRQRLGAGKEMVRGCPRFDGNHHGDWADAARDGKMPALLMNSMLVERGQPVVFSNTRFPARPDSQARIANFYDLYPNQYLHYDIRVNTAARLSASFSYVAPPSRPYLDVI
jgi:hypothetical protein